MTTGPADAPALLSAWLVPDWEGTPANVAPEEHDDIRWFDIDDMPPPAHVPVRAALSLRYGVVGSDVQRAVIGTHA